MFETFDWTKYLINIPKHKYQSSNICGNICFDFFFSSCNHNIYILIVTRLFKIKVLFRVGWATGTKHFCPSRLRLLAQTVYLMEYYFFWLAHLFNLSFMTGVFSSVLKITKKVVPVFKKDSKLDYNNY